MHWSQGILIILASLSGLSATVSAGFWYYAAVVEIPSDNGADIEKQSEALRKSLLQQALLNKRAAVAAVFSVGGQAIMVWINLLLFGLQISN